MDGVVEKTWYFPGKFFNADLAKASTENERAVIYLRTPDGQDVIDVLIRLLQTA